MWVCPNGCTPHLEDVIWERDADKAKLDVRPNCPTCGDEMDWIEDDPELDLVL